MATRNIVILGAGSAGTMMANHLKHKLHDHDWKVTIIDENQNSLFRSTLNKWPLLSTWFFISSVWNL